MNRAPTTGEANGKKGGSEASWGRTRTLLRQDAEQGLKVNNLHIVLTKTQLNVQLARALARPTLSTHQRQEAVGFCSYDMFKLNVRRFFPSIRHRSKHAAAVL